MNYHHISSKLWGGLLIVSLIVTLTFPSVIDGKAKENYLPLENVKPGMTGEGYSVFLGTKIQRFNVKILSIVDG